MEERKDCEDETYKMCKRERQCMMEEGEEEKEELLEEEEVHGKGEGKDEATT